MTKVQCFCCQKYGHVATQCNKKYRSYCTHKGHVLPECRRRAQSYSQKANLATLNASSSALILATNTMMPAQPASSSSLTPEMIQQIIVNAFSALGLSVKTKNSNSTWYLDLGASSHITHSSNNLSYLKPYDGNLRINTANGGSIPITAIGEISHPLPLSHVVLSPQ